MTYEEFCDAVSKSAVALMMSGPYKDETGEGICVAVRTSEDEIKDHVGLLLGLGCKVYAQVSGNNWICATGANPSGDAELITP